MDNKKLIEFPELFRRFCLSRGGLCFAALAIALLCRVGLGAWPTMTELIACSALLFAWPQIEIAVHWAMHHVSETQLHRRHQFHHQFPDSDTALGTWPTYLGYCLLPIPAIVTDAPILSGLALTLVAALTTYEFIHFSNHQPYKPLTAYGRRQREHHDQHHAMPKKHLAVVFPPTEAKAEP